MPTWTALTTMPGGDTAAALADALETLHPAPTGVGQFDLEDGSGLFEVGGYFTEKPDIAGLDLLAALHGARPFAVSKLDDRDWVVQVRRELTPVTAGRFVVHGSHDRGVAGPGQIALEIEAAMAFGTGHHATTQGCLTALDRIARAGRVAPCVADIGCGTGVLAMAAARLWRRDVIAADIDPVAAATARANFRANGIDGQVRALTAPGFRHPDLRARAPYDLVFANILAGPLRRLAPDMARHTAPGSALILSGILTRQAIRVARVYAGFGFTHHDRIEIGDWTTLVLRRS